MSIKNHIAENRAAWKRTYHETKSRDGGFSLLEMVVAMGILIVLTVGGVLAYNGINQNAKEGATLAAAKSVHTAALAYDVDNDGGTLYTDAADEYNSSQDSDEGKSSLVTQVNKLDDGSLCSVATYGDDEIVEVVGTGSAEDCVSGSPSDDGGAQENTDEYPGYDFVSTWVPSNSTDTCAGGKETVLPLSGTVDATVDWGDGSDPVPVNSAFPSHCYADTPVGDEVNIKVTGSFTGYGTNSSGSGGVDLSLYASSQPALISIDKWGDTGTLNASHAFYAARNLVSVDEPPTTVTTMQTMFVSATSFNQDISDWKVSNVVNMTAMFRYADSFSQDISKWDVSKVSKWIYFSDDSGLDENDIPLKFRSQQ